MDSAVSQLLGGENVLGPYVSSNLDLARATREGLPTRAAVELAIEILEDESHLSDIEFPHRADMLSAVRERRNLAEHGSAKPRATWALDRTVVVVALGNALGPLGAVVGSLLGDLAAQKARELHWNQLRDRLTPAESDLVVRIATALAHATAVLGNKKKAVHWLSSSNRALGGEVPISLLDTSAGEHEVRSLLDRIEYGVYS